MTRARRPAPSRRQSPDGGTRQRTPLPPSPTPVPAARLVASVHELRGLVDELAELTGCGHAWAVRVLRRNIELALRCPETLDGPENQLDFIEELAGALWDAAGGGLRSVVRPAETAEATGHRDQRRRAALGRLDGIAHGLCAEAEAWRRGVAEARARARPGYPQDDHRF